MDVEGNIWFFSFFIGFDFGLLTPTTRCLDDQGFIRYYEKLISFFNFSEKHFYRTKTI